MSDEFGRSFNELLEDLRLRLEIFGTSVAEEDEATKETGMKNATKTPQRKKRTKAKAKAKPEINPAVIAFLETGDQADSMALLADQIACEENADNLDTHSTTLLNAIVSVKNADPDRVVTAFGAVFICEMHAGLVRTQQGKNQTQQLCFPSAPELLDNKRVFDFEQERWISESRRPKIDDKRFQFYCTTLHRERADFAQYDEARIAFESQKKKMDDECEEKTGQNMFGFRYDENQKREKNAKEKTEKTLAMTGIKSTVQQIVNMADFVQQLAVERQHERGLFLTIAEIHLNNLFELAQSFMRKMRVVSFDEWQINVVSEEFESCVEMLQSETSTFCGVSGAYGLSILTSGVDILHDLQIFLKGQLSEIRRSQFMERIAVSLEGMQRELSEAVSVMRGIRHEARLSNVLQKEANILQERTFRRLDYILDAQHENNWLQHQQLKSLGALGMVVSSMQFSSSTHTNSFGLFGGHSSTTHSTGGPRLSFGDALRHIESNRPRLLLQ